MLPNLLDPSAKAKKLLVRPKQSDSKKVQVGPDSSRSKFGRGNVTRDSGVVKATKIYTLKKIGLYCREDFQQVLNVNFTSTFSTTYLATGEMGQNEPAGRPTWELPPKLPVWCL